MRKVAELRKAEIVSTVLDLADRIGPDRVTTGAVASAVGISQAALFRHFSTKALMWQAVATQIAERLTAAWQAGQDGADGPLGRMKGLIGAQLDQISATPAMPMLLFSRELNVENDALRAAFRGLVEAFRTLLTRAVEGGQEQGLFRVDVAAADAAVLLVSLVQGVAIRWSLGARNFSLREEGMRLLDVQLRLLAAREA